MSQSPSIFRRYFIILLLCYAVWIALYYLTAYIGEVRGPSFDPSLAIDALFPVIPAFQLLYMLCYVIILGILLLSRDPAFLNRAYLAFIGANAAAFVIFALFPAQGPAREAVQGDGGAMLSMLHALDSRWNALPSLHVTNPWLVAFFAFREKGVSAWSLAFTVIAIGISLSTLFIRQHYLLDVVAGMTLALVAYVVVEKMDVSPRPWRLPWEK